MGRAREWILEHGGLERTRVFTRIWLALFGLWPWDELPALPPELILLPPWFPLNIYDFACWARQTIVPLTVVGAHRPVRPLPFDLDELRTRLGPLRPPLTRRPGRAGSNGSTTCCTLRAAPGPAGCGRAGLNGPTEWIVRRQEADGSWGGIQPPWVYSMIALRLLGYPLDHPVMRASFRGLDAFTIWSPSATSAGSRPASRRSGTPPWR